MNIQPAGAGGVVTCPWCGHQCPFPGQAASQAIDCGECHRGVDFGVPRPSWAILAHPDKRFVVLRLDEFEGDGRVTRDVVLLKEIARPLAMTLLREVR